MKNNGFLSREMNTLFKGFVLCLRIKHFEFDQKTIKLQNFPEGITIFVVFLQIWVPHVVVKILSKKMQKNLSPWETIILWNFQSYQGNTFFNKKLQSWKLCPYMSNVMYGHIQSVPLNLGVILNACCLNSKSHQGWWGWAEYVRMGHS